MNFRSRKLFVWLISFGAVLTVFLLYSLLSGTARIEIDIDTDSEAVDTNSDFDAKVGVVGDVGVGPVEVARFTDLNKDKQIEREFGFEKLLHKSGDEWAIEKPFMNIFRSSFKCYITADKGDVQVETAAGKTSPKDAKLTGNVVIHIVPEKGSSMGEGFIYLDDVIYISEKSQFSTDGPVRFTSQDANMLATGMELVYNDELGQLEFLRIINLESLHIRSSSQSMLFSSRQPRDAGPADTDLAPPKRFAKASSKVQTAGTPKAGKTETSATPGKKVAEQAEGQKYRCLFSKNVFIDHPEQVVLTDELFINNIFEPKGSGPSSAEADPCAAAGVQTSPDISKQDVASAPSASERQDRASADIVVTCDNGIFVTPIDSTKVYGSSVKPPADDMTIKPGKTLISSDDVNDRATFIAQRIDYDYGTGAGGIVASGPSELTFYANDIAGAPTTVPVTVTTQEKATFLPAENQAVFEGDCVCRMLRSDSGVEQEYTLSAPRLTVNLYRDKERSSAGSVNAVEHLTADEGVVQLANAKWEARKARKAPAGDRKLLGFVKLKCHRFDYDPANQFFLATGPDGLIAADHSKLSPQKIRRRKTEKFSLRKPCYAVLRGFDTLKYHLDSDHLVADSESGQMLIDYFPVFAGEAGEQIEAGASHIEAVLYETRERKLELSTLSAAAGISYREKDRQFAGSKLFYDASRSLMTIVGDETQPCLYNGAHVDQIEYNLKTESVKTTIAGPGQLQ